MATPDERVLWLLRRMVTCGRHGSGSGFITCWDSQTVDDFVAAFPEAKRTLIYYSMGPHSSPMLNRAARRARDAGYISPGSIGNEDARSFNQRTWCRTWRITDAGRQYLATAPEKG